MAGDWIKMRHDLRSDPAVISISEALGIDEDTVVGKLHRFWTWADKQTVNGNAPGVTYSWVDRYLCVTGFAQAMANAGWLTLLDGVLGIPNFDKHISQSAKLRALTASRQARFKVTHSALPREEKRREEYVSPNGDTSVDLLGQRPRSSFFFSTSTGSQWEMPVKKLDEYLATYGDRLDVAAELRKAKQWLADNRDRRPRAGRGIAQFLTRWMNRSYDKAQKLVPGSRVADSNGGKAVFNAETGELEIPLE